MSRRLIVSTLVVACVVVLLLGVPLGFVETRSLSFRAREELRAEAGRLLVAVELRGTADRTGRQQGGRPGDGGVPRGNGQGAVPAASWRVGPDRHAVVTVPDRTTPITLGTPVRERDPLRVRLVGMSGEVVELTGSRRAVDADVRRAVAFIFSIAVLAIVAAVAMAVMQARRLAAPLLDLVATAERLGSGDPRSRQRHYGVPELDRVADVLDGSAKRIARMLAAERQLAADASHQLRTPLTALSMRLEEIISTDDPATVKEEATVALTQVERLTDVVERLLTNAREPRASGAVALEVDTVVRQQVEEWRPAYDNAGRRIEVTGSSGLRAMATRGPLTHVVATVLENALIHGEGTVSVRCRSTGRSVVVEVSDEGPGVPEELATRVFERSVSGGNSTGLGLAVARDLAEADGGRLELVQQRPPVFAVFLVNGVAPGQDQDQAEPAATGSRGETAPPD